MTSELIPTIPGYGCLHPLGEGGFGRVFKARQAATGRTFAIKIARMVNGDRQRLARFRRELSLCRSLHHPNIVGLVDQGEAEGLPYAVFEHIDGAPLSEVLLREKKLKPTEAKRLMLQALDALACAHARGVVHRDLKPSNIMITSTGAVRSLKLLDFGIGMFLPEVRGEEDLTLTSTLDTLGTPAYASPEQLRGDPVTVRSDLYSWGLVFLECLTGRRVALGSSVAEMYLLHLSPADVVLPPAIQRHHPLATVLRKALRKDARRRAASAAELLEELESVHVGDLVGELSDDSLSGAGPVEETWAGGFSSGTRRQVTTLSATVTLLPVTGANVDPEVLGALQADQLSVCLERCGEFGGQLVGTLGNRVLVRFGVASVSDANPRLALRTAATLLQEIKQRSERLRASQGVRVEFRAGLDTGIMRVARDGSVAGLADSVANYLQELAEPDSVVVSEAMRRRTEKVASFTPLPLRLPNGFPGGQEAHLLVDCLPSASSSSPAGGDQCMLGRDEEVAFCTKRLEQAEAGRGGSLLVSGDPGIGKSTLLHEVERSAREREMPVYECRCLPEFQHSALHPIVELVRGHLGLSQLRSGTEVGSALKRALEKLDVDGELAVPVLCLWLSLPLPPGFAPLQHAPAAQKQILFRTLRMLIGNWGSEPGALLAIEDLHWADPTTLEFLGELMQGLAGSHLLVMMTARSRFDSPFTGDCLDTLWLERLDPPTTRALVATLVDIEKTSPAVVDGIVARTDGVPLFIEEYTRMLQEQGSLVEEDGLDEDLAQPFVPHTLHELLMERLERSGAMRETIQLAAVIGREFDVNLVVRASSTRTASEIQLDLDTLKKVNLIDRNRQAAAGSYQFRHALIRDAAYDSIPLDARRRAHQRVAAAMMESQSEAFVRQPAVIATHLAEAEDYVRAIELATQAAASALQRSINQECVLHADRALKWLQKLPPRERPSLELSIMELRAKAQMDAHGWASAEARECLDRCQELIVHDANAERAIDTLCARFTSHFVASDRAQERQLVEQFMALSYTNPWAKSAAAFVAGVNHHIEGRYAEAELATENAIRWYHALDHRNRSPAFGVDVRIWATDLLAQIRWARGSIERAIATADHGVEMARQKGHVPSLCHSLMYRSQLHQFCGDAHRVLESTTELLKLSNEYGLAAYQAYGTIVHGWASGEAAHSEAILRSLEDMKCWCALAYHKALLVDDDIKQGRLEQALSRTDACLALCDRLGERYYEPQLWLLRARVLQSGATPSNAELVRTLRTAGRVARRAGVHRVEQAALLLLSRLTNDHGSFAARLAELGCLLNDDL